MNEQQAQQIIDMIQKGVDWTQVQGTEFAAEYLQYYAYHTYLWGGVALLFLLLGLLGVVLLLVGAIKRNDTAAGIGAALALFCGIPGAIGTVVKAQDLVKLHTAPKVILIEKLQQFVR